MKYSAFVDALGITAFQLDFLARAVSVGNEDRPAMNYIRVEPSDKGGGLLGIATNGQHLHLVDPLEYAEVQGITPGLWRVLKHSQKQAWIVRIDDTVIAEDVKYDFPKWRCLFTGREAAYTTVFGGISLRGGFSGSESLSRFILGFPKTTEIDVSYLADLGTGFTWNVEWYGAGKAVKFTEGNRVAIISPIPAPVNRA